MMHLERSAEHTAKKVHVTGSQKEQVPVMVRIDRMRQALAGPRTAIPAGMSAEEIRAFILSAAATRK